MRELQKLEERVVLELRRLYQRYGYAQFKMSKFEAYDLYMQNKEFLVSAGIITFTDTDGTLMALKPDVTLSIVKNYRSAHLQKVCYSENVYRVSGASRSYREIMQTGLECMGDVGLYEISETILLAVRSLQAISPSYLLDVSHLDIVSQVLASAGLDRGQSAEALRCIAEMNEDGLQRLCAGLPQAQTQQLMDLLQISGPLPEAVSKLDTLSDAPAVQELKQLAALLHQQGLADRVNLDFSIVSDLNYYNGFVFRGYVEGIPESILSGGQYDRLMEKMGKPAKGVGFAVYLDQLELLETRTAEHDVDTVLLYGPESSLAELTEAANTLSADGVLLLKEIPEKLRYRRLMKLVDGRLEEIENHG